MECVVLHVAHNGERSHICLVVVQGVPMEAWKGI